MLFSNQVSIMPDWRTIQYFTQFCHSLCFYYTSQELERSMDLHTSFVYTIKLKNKLAVSTTRNKNVYQKVL